MKMDLEKRSIKKFQRRVISVLFTAIFLVYSIDALCIPVWAGDSATVTPSADATAMANLLLGSGCPYTISNAAYTGAGTAEGTFTGAKSQVGFDSGIVLSTGNLVVDGKNMFNSAVTINSSSITGGVPSGGRTYINLGFPSNLFQDLSMLEFDVTASATGNISFQYCMASEEYPGNLMFADQFVLEVNGTNYAMIPGTSTPVSIATVNDKTNSSYYRGVTTASATAGAISMTNFVFNGETTVFSVSAPVHAGVNHIMMAIADYDDNVYDSAVFIKAGSLKSTEAQPGVFGFGNKTGNSLEVNRANGTDGSTQVDVTFQDAGGNQISKTTLTFDDGISTRNITIPENATKAVLSNATGGASVDPALSTKNIANASAPTASNPTNQTKHVGEKATFSVTATVTDNGTLTYQWQKNTDGTWVDINAATEASYTTENLTKTDSGTQYRCVVTNTLDGTTAVTTSQGASLTVNAIAVAPKISKNPENVSNYYGENVTFSVKATTTDNGTLTYQWQKNSNGTWTNISGATAISYTKKAIAMSDNNMQYRCVITNSLDGTTASVTSSVVTITVNSSLKIVEDRIDALPNPSDPSNQTILNNQQNIKETKQLFDKLTDSERSTISQERKDKLNALIERLSEVLVVEPKDTTTGVTAGGISTAVILPELANPDVSKVLVQLNVTPVTNAQNPENLKKAVEILGGDGKEILATYDLALIKSIFNKSNALVSSGKVDNSQIVDYITIRIPVPDGYAGRTDMTVVYVDDNGNVTPLTTTLVTINGIQYLQFQTNHFSEYAVTATASKQEVTTATPKTGDPTNIAEDTFLILLSGMFILYNVKNRKSARINVK